MKGTILVLAALSAAGLLVAAGVVFLGADKVTSLHQGEGKAAVGAAMQALTFNQEILGLLGAPVTIGETTVQREDISLLGSGTIALNIAVSGTKSAGHVSVNLTKATRSGAWRVTNGTFYPTSGPPVFIRGR